MMVNPERGSFMPAVLRTRLRFAESWDNTTAIPGFYDWVIRGNSIYDPDYALSADSCYGLAAMAGIYTSYKVLASSIRVTVTNNDDDDPVNCAIVPAVFPDSFAAANQDGLLVHPLAKHMSVSKLSGGKTLQHMMMSHKMFNVSNLDSVNFSALFTANPATIWYWHVVTWNNAGTASDCEMLVSVTYDVECFGLKAFEQ